MTVKELKVFFKEHLVPSHLYNLKGGSHGGKFSSKSTWFLLIYIISRAALTAEGSASAKTSRTSGKCISVRKRTRSGSCSSRRKVKPVSI